MQWIETLTNTQTLDSFLETLHIMQKNYYQEFRNPGQEERTRGKLEALEELESTIHTVLATQHQKEKIHAMVAAKTS